MLRRHLLASAQARCAHHLASTRAIRAALTLTTTSIAKAVATRQIPDALCADWGLPTGLQVDDEQPRTSQ